MIKPFHAEKLKQYVYTKTRTQMFTAALLVIAKEWENPNVHEEVNG